MAFHIKQNDTSPSISVELKDADNSAINLTGASVKIFVKSLGGTLKVNSTMVIVETFPNTGSIAMTVVKELN